MITYQKYNRRDLRRVTRVLAMIVSIFMIGIALIIFSFSSEAPRTRVMFVNGICLIMIGAVSYWLDVTSDDGSRTKIPWMSNFCVGTLWVVLGVISEIKPIEHLILVHYASVGLLSITMNSDKFTKSFILLAVFLDIILLFFVSSTISFALLEIIILSSIVINISNDLRQVAALSQAQ